jgi:galactosyl transferase GMA12/MNN10 family
MLVQHRDDNCRKALVTLGTDSMGPVLDVALPTFRRFAERHSYNLVIGDASLCDGRPPAWTKVPLLYNLMESFDFILWIDADAIILDFSQDPVDLLPKDAYQAMVKHQSGELVSPNTGVWLLRSGQRSRDFLREVWNSEQFIEHRYWENAAVIDLLGYGIESLRLEYESPWFDGTYWLPTEWNSHVGWSGLSSARIRHYAGMTNLTRARNMKVDLNYVLAAQSEGYSCWKFYILYGIGELMRRPIKVAKALSKHVHSRWVARLRSVFLPRW